MRELCGVSLSRAGPDPTLRPTLRPKLRPTHSLVPYTTPTHSCLSAIIPDNLSSIFMSATTPGQLTPSENLKSILDPALSKALTDYKKKTGQDLLDHPLATQVQRCDSVDAIKAIFQRQAEEFQQFKDGDQKLMKWIIPVVDVLYKCSTGPPGDAAVAVRHLNLLCDCILTLWCRRSPLQKSCLQGSVSSLLSVSSP